MNNFKAHNQQRDAFVSIVIIELKSLIIVSKVFNQMDLKDKLFCLL